MRARVFLIEIRTTYQHHLFQNPVFDRLGNFEAIKILIILIPDVLGTATRLLPTQCLYTSLILPLSLKPLLYYMPTGNHLLLPAKSITTQRLYIGGKIIYKSIDIQIYPILCGVAAHDQSTPPRRIASLSMYVNTHGSIRTS